MKTFKKTLTAAAAVAALFTASGAMAADRDRDGRPDNSWAETHDQDGYHDNQSYNNRQEQLRHHRYNVQVRRQRAILAHDRIYGIVQSHHYRYIGSPYYYRGHYGVRAYDTYGKIVFVGVDPYSGAWGGVQFRF